MGGSLGGAAGVLYALKFTRIDPFVGFMPGIKAFAAAVLGGIGNLTGALLGGIVLGMIESFAGAYLGTFTQGAFGAEYKDMVAFLILILVIIFRPNGLLGEQRLAEGIGGSDERADQSQTPAAPWTFVNKGKNPYFISIGLLIVLAASSSTSAPGPSRASCSSSSPAAPSTG